MEELPFFATIAVGVPAVKNDRLVVIERIGYPGAITGRRSLVEMYQRVYGVPEVVATPDA